MSRLRFLSREAFAGITTPVARAFLKMGLSADAVTIMGTAGVVMPALTLFPTGRLFAGTLLIGLFVCFDMLDGAIARQNGGGTRFGTVLDATCDRISDGAIFAGLLWWAVFGLRSESLTVAILICLITSQVISYIKARAAASGLRGDGGVIERPERLIITLMAAGVSDLPLIGVPGALPASMWLLAVASVLTCVQRLHRVRTSEGAMDGPRSAPR